jgi:ubiquitin carboxyl-terminal hydrolase 47
LACNNDSIREERFQELILAIKNTHEKVYNPSLELSLQRYVKPEMLDENNLYDCNYCQSKVRAQRGVKFIKSPKLLNLVLQRFMFDYESWVRLKINDRISFPFVLNFNHYFNGYEQIPNKIREDTS